MLNCRVSLTYVLQYTIISTYKNTYHNKNFLSIVAKLKHYKTAIKPKTTYTYGTIFKTTNTEAIKRLLNIERRKFRVCININNKTEVWRLVSKDTVYKKIEPIIKLKIKRNDFHS